ncbi:transcription termination factor Rho [Streptacidiphilus rugosus]|uniref:transcription termination factor Rho n=1 Tax=Streptacidiphilus rugosus TaxID=405783 RepID=UPI00056729EA|nr:transcription termination factor Rho [Streptacidiphilus rugosus]
MTTLLETPTQTQLTLTAGVFDLDGNRGVLRVGGYLPGPDDVSVSAQQVRRFGLRRGDLVETGPEGIARVNGRAPETLSGRPAFAELTPLHPQERLRLETDPGRLTTRVIDLLAPVGKGQRGLIVAPPKTGKTAVLQALADAIARNHPECHLMVLLVDERPEEVTEMTRSVRGEVLASTFDRPAKEHTRLASLAVERAKRLVEAGQDVVMLVDSLTRLCRAHNAIATAGQGRTLSGGVDAGALLGPKQFFGAARNIENGGSLTILATALVETGSRADDYYFEELKSTGNLEIRLDRALAAKRVFPAVVPTGTGTRREELLTHPDELTALHRLRRALAAQQPQQAVELMLERLKKTSTNAEFLRQVQLTTPAAR